MSTTRPGMSRPMSSWSGSGRRGSPPRSRRTIAAPKRHPGKSPRGRAWRQHAGRRAGLSEHLGPRQGRRLSDALCGPYTVPEPMVRVWAEEMCRNNDWLASLGGDPQEHQHQPVGIEFPDLPGADCVHKFHDGPTYGYSYTWKLFERLVKRAADPHPLRDPGPSADPARHHQGNPRRARATRREAGLCQGAAGGRPDLRRVREQPGDDPRLPARRPLLLHLRLALQRRRRHRDGDGGRRRSLAHEQLRRPVDGAEGAGNPHEHFRCRRCISASGCRAA